MKREQAIQAVLIPTYKKLLPRGEAKLSGLTFEGKQRRWPGLEGGIWRKAWSDLDKMVHLADGSFIEFKSYEKTHTIAEDELMMLTEWIKSK